MNNTMLMQVVNQKAFRLIHELEELNLIKVLKENVSPARTRLSDKYKGVFSKEDAKSFDEHTQAMRGEMNYIEKLGRMAEVIGEAELYQDLLNVLVTSF